MKLAAFILCIISTVSMGCFLIPLAWCIPMTIKVYKAYKGEEELGTGFMVCTLLFVNMVQVFFYFVMLMTISDNSLEISY